MTPTNIFIVEPIHHTFECPLLLEQLLLLLKQYLSEISTSMLIILLILLSRMTSYSIKLTDLRRLLLLVLLWLDLLVIAWSLECFELPVACFTEMSIITIILAVTITLIVNIPIQTVIVIFIVLIILLVTSLPRLLLLLQLLILLPYNSFF